MNAGVLETLRAHHVRIVLSDGDIKLCAAKGIVGPEIIELLRQRKQEIIAAVDRRNKTSTEAVPMAGEPDQLSQEDVDLVCRAIDPQPPAVYHWILGDGGHAETYEYDRGYTPRDANMTAAVDLLLWQYEFSLRGDGRAERVRELLGLLRAGMDREATGDPVAS